MIGSDGTMRLGRRAALGLIAGAGMALAAGPVAAQGRTRPINTRTIPKSGEALPMVGLGTWQGFDVGRSAAERAPRREVLEALFAAEASVVDSSPMYGRAEAVTGDLLAEMGARSKAFLATKVWTRGRADGIAQMERSFELLRTDRIDLMQVHNLVDWRTHLATIDAWKAEGRFRYSGITHYTSAALDDLADVIEAVPVDFVQFAYSITVREPEARFLSLCADKGIAVLINRPFEGGGLFRRLRGKPLPDWAAAFDCESWAQFMLKYILGHPAVTCVIPGTSKPHHMIDNLGAGRGRLPDMATRRRMVELVESL